MPTTPATWNGTGVFTSNPANRSVLATWPIAHTVTIQLMVPRTRMLGNSLPGFFICANEIEFVSASVGM
ncbi:MAG: hypothetical protein M5U12_19910 [Verrucomicrobia bacterium]|nr:hypothetical protein [Verrucomicrobiota bacterium]